jgi:hypothetical protein
MGRIGCIHCEKFWCDLMAQTCALMAPAQPILHLFRVVIKLCQMHRNTTKHTKTWVLGPIGWIGCVHSEKFRCDLMARTCALILLVQPALHRVSCSNETIQNAPKHYKTHKNLSLGSNGVDRVRSLPKIPMRVRGIKFCINCISSARFAPSFTQ